MEERDKFEANKLKNAPFLRALAILMKEKNINQAQVAELLNTKSGTFSDYKNGKKRAGQDMFERLALAFHGRLNMHYLSGESEYMMLENVPDEEMCEYAQRDCNPDFDVQKRAKTISSIPTEPVNHIPDMSSVFNSALAAKDDAIESLKRELRTKDDLIQSLRDQLTAKDQLIAEQKARLIDYRRIIDSRVSLSDYPFPVGAADGDKRARLTK